MSSEYLEAGLQDFLSSQANITGITGTHIAGGLLPESLDSPSITYSREDFKNTYSMAGEAGIASATIYVRCWGGAYREAKHLAERVRDVCSGYDGAWGTYNVVCFVDDKMEDETYASPGNEQAQRLACMTLEVWHDETTIAN